MELLMKLLILNRIINGISIEKGINYFGDAF